MTKIFLVIASILGGLSVVAGSFASHALKEKLSQYSLDIFQTGARLQTYHSLALLMVAFFINNRRATPIFNGCCWICLYYWNSNFFW